MGFLSSLFSGPREEPPKQEEEKAPVKAPVKLPEMTIGMILNVTIQGKALLSGRLTALDGTNLTIERTPGQLSFDTCEAGTEAVIRGYNNNGTMPFDLKCIVEESSRIIFKAKDLELIPFDEHRASFRLSINAPVSLYYQEDSHLQNPEVCTLVDISTGGACIQSEFLHAEGEVLHLKVQIEEYAPMTFLGQIIRVQEYSPGIFRYGFLFAQLDDQETTALTKVLFNVQVGNKKSWQRSASGSWN